MNITIVDYKSGNISSVINSFNEVAKDKVKIEVLQTLIKLNRAIKLFYQDKVRSKKKVVSMDLIISKV